jgi:quinol monooxygenase YgiN
MITLISKWTLRQGCPPELLTALQELVAKSKSEHGNLMYEATLFATNPLDSKGKPLSPSPLPIKLEDQKKIVFIESYENAESLSQHLQGEAFSSFLKVNIKYFCEDPNNPSFPKTETDFLDSIISVF